MGSDGDGYNVKLKMKDSLEQAQEQSSGQAGSIDVGSNGWAELEFTQGKSLPQSVLVRWIEESCRLLAPKKLVAKLDAP